MALPTHIGVFDTETDGVDLEDTRIITAFIGVMETATGQVILRHSWVLLPERDISTAASDIHGYTTARAQAEGMDRQQGIMEITDKLMEIADAMPIVAMNAIYDFTILDREIARLGLTDDFGSQWEFIRRDDRGNVTYPTVFDPMVFDRAVDKYRKGTRKLVDLARVYGVPVEENAHDAEADCRMAGRVAIVLMGHSRLIGMSPQQIHAKLILTYRSNSVSLAEFWEKGLYKLAEPMKSEKIAAIADVRSKSNHWPCVPRPNTKEQSA